MGEGGSDVDSDVDSRVVTENEVLNRVVTRSRSRQLVVTDHREDESEEETPEPPAVTTRKRKLSHPSAVAGARKRARSERSSSFTPPSAYAEVFEETESLVPLELSDKVSKIIAVGLEPSRSKALRDKYCPSFENSDFSGLDEDFYVRFKVPGVKSADTEDNSLRRLGGLNPSSLRFLTSQSQFSS